MRAAQVYIITTLLYFLVGTGSIFWAGFNMITVLGCTLAFMHGCLRRGRASNLKKAWIEVAGVLTLGRIIYTFACMVAPVGWIYSGNLIFAISFGLWITIKMCLGTLKVR